MNNSLRQLATTFEPGRYTGDQAVTLVELMAETERLAGAVKALAAARVDESNRWRREGHRSAAHWMAAKTGTSVHSAAEAINTAKRIKDQPHVDEAFRNGQLSASQAGEISATAALAPNTELDLLHAAKTETLTALREKGRRARHAALPNEIERNGAIHRSRYFRSRTTADGAFEASLRLTPLDGGRLMSLLQPFQKTVFDNARRTGIREPFEAYAADALLAMAEARNPHPTAAPTPSPAPGSAPTSHAAATRAAAPTSGPPPACAPASNPASDPAPHQPATPPATKASASAQTPRLAATKVSASAEAPTPASTQSSASGPAPPRDQPDPGPPPSLFAEPIGQPPPAPPPGTAPSPMPAGADIPDRPIAMIDIRVDLTALRRGHTVEGEVCEIPGIGPIPVATATMLASDAIINVLLVDGVDVIRVAHTGRTVNAHQRSALRERTDTCEVPFCDASDNLEIDHDNPWAITKTTRLDDLNVLCRYHHHQKTHHGYRLTGPPGNRQWHPPGTRTAAVDAKR